MEILLLMMLAFSVVCGCVSALIISYKNRDMMGWFFLGFFLNFIGVVGALAIESLRKCPMCAEVINDEAKICKHCHTKL